MRRSRIGLLAVALVAAACAAPACGPKSGGGTNTVGSPQPGTPTPKPLAEWHAPAKQLLELGLGGPRRFWNEPVIRPGERVRWVITAKSFPDRFLEVARSETKDAEVWDVIAGHPKAERGDRRGAQVWLDRGKIGAIVYFPGERQPYKADEPKDIAEIIPLALFGTAGEASFTAMGGTFLGNEVLRVPGGEYRARHAVISKDGTSWHLYLVRTVPGGIAKVEQFRGAATEPILVMELDDSTRLPKKPAP